MGSSIALNPIRSLSLVSNLGREKSEMYDQSSFESGNGALAREMQALVQQASGQIRPGDSIKTQINRAHANLGRPPYWRVRAAWYGEGQAWSAAVVDDFRQRLKNFEEKQERGRHAKQSADAIEVIEMRKRLRKLRLALAQADPKDFSQEIYAIDYFLGRTLD